MKNFKKIVAAMAAASMMLSLSVAAFADDSATYDADTETVSVDCDTIDAANQWTVIIIDAAMQNEDLDADDLYYINQGTANDTFWTAMGTKEALTDGDYLVRIGGTTLDEVIEIELTVSSTPTGKTIQLGDCDGVAGIDIGDVTAIFSHILGEQALTGDNLVAGDCDGVAGIDIGDVTAVFSHILGENPLGTTTI